MIQRIGKKGGRVGNLKYQSGFDYYQFSATKVSSSQATQIFQRGGLGFNDLFRIRTGEFSLEAQLFTICYLNPGGAAFTYDCSNIGSPELTLFRNTVELYRYQNCPISAGANETVSAPLNGYLAGEFTPADDIFFRLVGGSGSFIETFQVIRGFFKITAGQLQNYSQSGQNSFGTVTLKKLN